MLTPRGVESEEDRVLRVAAPDPDRVWLLAYQPTLEELRCRFGCAGPVVGIYHTPEGCICWPDRVQALCAQHALSVDGGPVTPIIVFWEYRTEVAA